jgi:hypothetical protein
MFADEFPFEWALTGGDFRAGDKNKDIEICETFNLFTG